MGVSVIQITAPKNQVEVLRSHFQSYFSQNAPSLSKNRVSVNQLSVPMNQIAVPMNQIGSVPDALLAICKSKCTFTCAKVEVSIDQWKG